LSTGPEREMNTSTPVFRRQMLIRRFALGVRRVGRGRSSGQDRGSQTAVQSRGETFARKVRPDAGSHGTT